MKLTADLKLKAAMVLIVFSSSLFASFDPLPVGGRAAGMSQAYTAIADDVYALHYNPAGVLQMTRPEIGTYYSQLYPGLTDNSQITRSFLGYAQPVGRDGKKGAVGVNYTSLQLSSLYKEESFGVTYGREVKRLWNVGGTVKLLRKQIGSDMYTANAIDPNDGTNKNAPDPLLAKSHSASALSLDLGAQYLFARAYALGIAFRNVNQPDLGLASEKDAVPAVYAFSLARRLRTGSLGVELNNWKTADNNYRLALGGETWKNRFGLRGGASIGSNNASSLSVGASYRLDSIQLDYAMIYPLQGIEGTLGVQQISLTIRLGRPPVDPLEKQLIREKEERIRAETEARNAKAERDRLKKQLYDLTENQSQAEKEAERRAAQRALQDAQDQELRGQREKAAPKQEPSSAATAQKNYTTAVAEYNTKVNAGIGLAEKKKILERIMNDFGPKGVDVSTVNRELKNLRVEEIQAKKDFDLSMSFYRRLAQQGASTEDRRGMLERIIQKYQGSGIDTSSAQEEMKSLK